MTRLGIIISEYSKIEPPPVGRFATGHAAAVARAAWTSRAIRWGALHVTATGCVIP